jgi:ankyrin repeat protein
MAETTPEAELFRAALAGLRRGDFTASASLFANHTPSSPCPILRWLDAGWFADTPDALLEAFTCACFLGETDVVRALLERGLDPQGGSATGLNALHWASNRGQLGTVRILLERHPPLEVRNTHGGTVLSGTVWAAIYEPRPAHGEIIEALLRAGARLDAVDYPTGNEAVDKLLRQYGAERG